MFLDGVGGVEGDGYDLQRPQRLVRHHDRGHSHSSQPQGPPQPHIFSINILNLDPIPKCFR